ncbi:hypothetical protein [Gemmatimonas sp.]
MSATVVIVLVVGCALSGIMLGYNRPSRQWAAMYPFGVGATVAASFLRKSHEGWAMAIGALALALIATSFWFERTAASD